jgi:hypothetical protein
VEVIDDNVDDADNGGVDDDPVDDTVCVDTMGYSIDYRSSHRYRLMIIITRMV